MFKKFFVYFQLGGIFVFEQRTMLKSKLNNLLLVNTIVIVVVIIIPAVNGGASCM
jgi:hypothetical protein